MSLCHKRIFKCDKSRGFLSWHNGLNFCRKFEKIHIMSKIIGIDLGTTNSCVSVMEGNEPVVIPMLKEKEQHHLVMHL